MKSSEEAGERPRESVPWVGFTGSQQRLPASMPTCSALVTSPLSPRESRHAGLLPVAEPTGHGCSPFRDLAKSLWWCAGHRTFEPQLYRAINFGNPKVLECLLDDLRKADASSIHTTTSEGGSLLHYACRRSINRDAVVELLVRSGVPLDAQDADGRTALGLACGFGSTPVVNLLLKKGADPALPDHEGMTPLMLAAAKGHGETLKSLLLDPNARATINSTDLKGQTALYLASAHRRPLVVRLLLKAGADATIATGQGTTPKMIASLSGFHDIMELLPDHLSLVDVGAEAAPSSASSEDKAAPVQAPPSLGGSPMLVDLTGSDPKAAAKEGGDEHRIETLEVGGAG
jgi:hypothetical protein